MDGLNEIIDANRASRQKGARLERENVEHCSWYILQAMLNCNWEKMTDKASARAVDIDVIFVEANARRDTANVIGGGLKYLLDALSRPRGSKGGVAAIYDDSPRWIRRIRTQVEIDPLNPGIEVHVTRVS